MTEMPRSQQAIDLCRKHADDAHAYSSASMSAQIEAMLAKYVSSTIYAEAEAIVVSLTAARAAHQTSDTRLRAFGTVAARKLIRSIKISDLAGILSHFDTACKAKFQDELNDQLKTDWDSLIQARHGVAHDQGTAVSYLSLLDVERYFPSVSKVLDVYAVSLHV